MDKTPFARLHAAVTQIRAGGMVILTDDAHRENEGDLCMAADAVSAAAINFMITHARGLVCLPMTAAELDRLALPPMVAHNTSAHGTGFSVSIEARFGVSTGISAADRARTIQVAVDPATKAEHLARPGHIFPLRAREGGVLARPGHTEGSVDLCLLARRAPAAVICEILREDGTMARLPDLEAFGRQHGLPLVTIAELVAYRRQGRDAPPLG